MNRFHLWLLMGGLMVIGLGGRLGFVFAEDAGVLDLNFDSGSEDPFGSHEEDRVANVDPTLTPREQEIREMAVNLYRKGYSEEEIRRRLESQFGPSDYEKASFELKKQGRELTRDEEQRFHDLVGNDEERSQVITSEEEARFREALVAERLEKERLGKSH